MERRRLVNGLYELMSENDNHGRNFGLVKLVELVFKGRIEMVLKNAPTCSLIQAQYSKLGLTDDDFSKITELLRKSIIKSKALKLMQLKKLILGFSELRSILVAQKISRTKSFISSEAMMTDKSYFDKNPKLFRKLGGIDGLTNIFSKFFEVASKDETLSALYESQLNDN